MFPGIEYIKTALNGITAKFRHVKTDVDAVKSDVDAVKNSAPDWNEPDSASHAYIKNKPCYNYIEPSGVIWESDSAGTSAQSALKLVDLVDRWLIEGETYRLTVDGVETTYTCSESANGAGLYIGVDDKLLGGSIFQSHKNTLLSAYNNNLWNKGQKVRLEGPLRKYKKLDTSLYDAVVSVNGETGEVEITPEDIGAANAGTKIASNYILDAVYGTYRGETCSILYLGGNRWFEKGITSDTGEECFLFSPFNTILAGIKTPTQDAHAANKGYVDATVAAPRDSIRLYSSTEGSSKRFEIKVNDSGTIKTINTDDSTEVQFAKTSDIPTVDSTLTQSGQAADAKTVGDALSNISEELANLQTSGLTTEQVNALNGLFKIVAYTADPTSAYSAFKVAFRLDGGGTGVTLSSISATYSGGDVAVGTALSALTGIMVTATYSDGSTATVTGYTLSGEIAEGSNTITVTYQGKTATFIVTGTAVAQTYAVTNNLTNVTNSNSATTASGYYSATLSAEEGYNINVNITMGGMDITADVYTEDGTILITEVTGDIVITATAELASSPIIYQLANTPRTVNADLYEDTGLTFGSNSANGYTKAWTMVAKVKNMSAGYLWCVAGQDNLSAKYENRWNGDVGNSVSHLNTAICATVVRPSITQVNPDEISVVITKEALSEKTATVYYLNYAGELQTSQCVGTYGKFSISVYAGNMMVGGKSSADFVGTIEEFTIYEGVATVEQIKSYLGVA